MKPSRWVQFGLIASVFVERSAWANQPPEPPAMLGEISIVPLALLVFSWSGAAKLYDETHRKPSHRGLALLASIFVTFASGMHEGLAALFAPLLCAYGIAIGLRMISVSFKAPPKSFTRKMSLWGGILLIPVVIFLAGLSWAFLGKYGRYSNDEWVLLNLKAFHAYQTSYSIQHEGRFEDLRVEEALRLDDDVGHHGGQWSQKWLDSGMNNIAENSKYHKFASELKYATG